MPSNSKEPAPVEAKAVLQRRGCEVWVSGGGTGGRRVVSVTGDIVQPAIGKVGHDLVFRLGRDGHRFKILVDVQRIVANVVVRCRVGFEVVFCGGRSLWPGLGAAAAS
jgi:hypothetical protein